MINPKKAIHLVKGNPGRGTLDYYFKEEYPNNTIQIHCIYNDLTTGPLNDLMTDDDYENYSSYVKNVEKIIGNSSNSADFQFPDLSNDFTVDFPEENPLIIWHGNNADEKLMLYRYCHLLRNRELHEINLQEWPTNPENNHTNSLATRNPEDLDGIFSVIRKIGDSRKALYSEEWERLKNDEKQSRIFEDGKVISVDEDYYDKSIVDNCTFDYRNAVEIIGETMAQYNIGDHYVFYRIHELINQNLLEGKGNPVAMRDFEVRKKNS